MKVGLVIDDHMGRPGGVQEYVRGLYHYLVQHGHAAVIFAGGAAGESDERVITLGRSLPFKGSGSSSSIPLTLETPGALRALLRHEACDVLHVMAPYSPTLSGRLLVQSEAVHVLTLLVALEPAWWRALLGSVAGLQWRSLRRFAGRIAISPVAAATGRALYGGRYELIPCGVDTAAFRPSLAARPQFYDERVSVLYVGRLEARKGVIFLLRAWQLLEQHYPNLRLLIAGDGPQRAVLEMESVALDLKHVDFLGYIPASDLPQLLATADLFCAPATHAESFGIVLVEALAAGLPIVAAGNSGYAGLLAAHPGNLVVPPGNPRALAGAIAALLDAPAWRKQVGQRNALGAQRYDWEVVGAQIVAVYHQLLEARAAL